MNALRVFRVVAEQGSFTAAAAVLDMTQAGVSAAVRSLERYVGSALFERGGRAVTLTARGQLLLDAVIPALDEVRSVLFLLRTEFASNALTITALPSFMQRWLLPRLANLRAWLPDLRIQFITHRSVLPLSANRIHAAIRYGAGSWPGVRAHKLLDEWMLPVASPAYLEARGAPRNVAELAKHRLIECQTEPWQAWLAAQGRSARLPQPALAIDDSALAVAAAECGEGVALARWSLAQGALEAGGLVALPGTPVSDRYAYYLAWPPELTEAAHFHRFRAWIESEVAAFPRPVLPRPQRKLRNP